MNTTDTDLPRGRQMLNQLLREHEALDAKWLPVVRQLSRTIIEKRLLDPDLTERLRQLQEVQEIDDFDPFGFEPEFLKWVLPFVAWVYRRYFRVEAHGLEHLPAGSVLLVANHSGQVPLDGMMIAASCLLDAPQPRMVRSMIERWVPTLPFVSWFFARCGQILGTRENFRLLNSRGAAILVFPEGIRGINKTYDKAYQLQRFGLGFMRLALENNLPIVPVAVIGAEEQAPALYNARGLARLLGAPALPITPTFPLLGPLGFLPLPVRYRLYYGEPMTFSGDPDDEDRVVEDKVSEVRTALEALIQHGLKQRKTIWDIFV
ncbi:MAG: lysophospholipid acyltransferase family protein [Myxococcota bacterium]